MGVEGPSLGPIPDYRQDRRSLDPYAGKGIDQPVQVLFRAKASYRTDHRYVAILNAKVSGEDRVGMLVEAIAIYSVWEVKQALARQSPHI